MAALTNISTYNAPGVYVSEGTYGAIPASLSKHNTVYMLGYTNKVGAVTNTPSFCQSTDDFYSQFGTSYSSPSVSLFFNQRSNSGLYFINVAMRNSFTLAVPTATAGATYTVTIDSYPISYVATATDTAPTILVAVGNAIALQASHLASWYSATNTLRVVAGKTVTTSANITLTPGSAIGSYPTVLDVVDALNTSFDPSMNQGFLIAPEFFQQFSSATDRAALANAMEALTNDPNYLWVSIADSGATTATQTTSAGAVNLAIAERNALTSPQGHTCYYFPYFVDLSNNLVPMSAAVVGVALRRYRVEGFKQPPAGVPYPVYGVSGTSYPVTTKIQQQLNPIGINCGRYLSNGKGTVIFACRTVSTNTYYTFMHTRVILNVLGGSLRSAYDSILFSVIDGMGLAMARVKATAVGYCEQLRLAGALYGASPDDAYLVVCDSTNNPPANLEQGTLYVDVIVKVSPVAEVIAIRLSKATLGTVLSEITSSGTTSAIQQPAATTSIVSGR